MSEAQQNFERFLEEFNGACDKAGRAPSEVGILPVSKGQSVERLRDYLVLDDFPAELAENYLEELSPKPIALPQVRWHYQGALQSRKINEILRHATVLQSVSRIKELELIFRSNIEITFYLQANISSEGQKLGASEAELVEILNFVSKSGKENNFLGLMGVASEVSDAISESHVSAQFAKLRELRDRLAPYKKLSMGMSADFHLAIREGSDLIRVGSSIFGKRVYL